MAVLKNINFKVSNSWVDLGNLAYPVGSIFQSTSSTSPATTFGGTWERIKDKFLLSAGDSYSAASTGGEAEHTLTLEEMPGHNHAYKFGTGNSGTYTSVPNENLKVQIYVDTYQNWGSLATVGGGQSHNNMPPYITVYTWKRTA